ncbi:MAG: hypothetical protein IPL39_10945 [Opitutaceae bacterium]|nr:hypothetical protein [Opitutaceae bacterium]
MFWERLVAELKALGHPVEVWTELTEDDIAAGAGALAGEGCFRVWAVFPLRVMLRCLRRARGRRGALLARTTPFYLPVLATLLCRASGLRVGISL